MDILKKMFQVVIMWVVLLVVMYFGRELFLMCNVPDSILDFWAFLKRNSFILTIVSAIVIGLALYKPDKKTDKIEQSETNEVQANDSKEAHTAPIINIHISIVEERTTRRQRKKRRR